MNRLASFAKSSPEAISADINIFEIFHKHVAELNKVAVLSNAASLQQALTDVNSMLALQVALLNFALNMNPDRLDYVDDILRICSEALQALNVQKLVSINWTLKCRRVEDANSVKHVVSLLSIPMESTGNVLTILALNNYPQLMNYLNYSSRKKVALTTVRGIHKNKTALTTVEHVEKLFSFIQPLVKDEPDQPEDDELDAVTFRPFPR